VGEQRRVDAEQLQLERLPEAFGADPHDRRVARRRLRARRWREPAHVRGGAIGGLIVDALAQLGVDGERLGDRVGVWVRRQEPEQGGHDKIAAIGVRLRRWVSSHGFSVNVAPNLEHFSGIVPCGIADAEATSLARLGLDVGLDRLDRALRVAFERNFGPTCEAEPGATAAAAEALAPA